MPCLRREASPAVCPYAATSATTCKQFEKKRCCDELSSSSNTACRGTSTRQHGGWHTPRYLPHHTYRCLGVRCPLKSRSWHLGYKAGQQDTLGKHFLPEASSVSTHTQLSIQGCHSMPSQSQASTIVNRGAGASTRSSAPTGALARRRPTGSREGGGSSSKRQTMNYYTDDSPGLKISPVVVIGMSLGFIGFVTILHVWSKIRGH